MNAIDQPADRPSDLLDEPAAETPGADAPDAEFRRREPRADLVQQVEYCGFPRAFAGEHVRPAFTRDVSERGLCLRTDIAPTVGALLRLTVVGLGVQRTRECIGRVAWTDAAVDGAHWVGVSLLDPPAAPSPAAGPRPGPRGGVNALERTWGERPFAGSRRSGRGPATLPRPGERRPAPPPAGQLR